MFRIVINFGSGPAAARNIDRIAGLIARTDDTVSRGGHLVEVLTRHPEKFIANFFAEGYTDTFTCQEESL